MLKYYPFTILFFTLTLAGCTFAPGMRMKSTMTPSLNANNQIVTPDIIPITAELVQSQRAEAAMLLSEKMKNYQPPTGFSTDTQGYQYQVGAQDVLRIIVWGHPDLNPATTDAFGVTVDSEGFIYYPYAGNLKVIGKTTNEVRELLTESLSSSITDPQVSVSITHFNSQKIYVSGAVKQPKALPITNVPLTVFNAVSDAGGPLRCGITTPNENSTLCANLKNVQITKNRQNTNTVVDLDTLAAIDGSSVNWILENGDKVYIPNNIPYRIFVLGSVVNPGPYNMNDGKMSLRDALADAHGVTIMSDPSYTYLIRNHNHTPQIFSLDANSPDSFNLAGDFELKADDIIFVSASKLETLNAVLNQVNPSLLTAVSTKALIR